MLSVDRWAGKEEARQMADGMADGRASVPKPTAAVAGRRTGSYTCVICNKSFITARRLRRHKKSVHERYSVKRNCKTCDKHFGRSDTMRRHIASGACARYVRARQQRREKWRLRKQKQRERVVALAHV